MMSAAGMESVTDPPFDLIQSFSNDKWWQWLDRLCLQVQSLGLTASLSIHDFYNSSTTSSLAYSEDSLQYLAVSSSVCTCICVSVCLSLCGVYFF